MIPLPGDQVLAEILETAARLAGGPVYAVFPARAGANSRLFRVETTAGRFALKIYPARPGDARPRADNEWKALRFLRAHGMTAVPEPVAYDPADRMLLMEWIEGEPPDVPEPSDLADAASFVTRIFARSAEADAVDFPLASEACLSLADIVGQIEQRLGQFEPHPEIDAFLAESFFPVMSAVTRQHETEIKNAPQLEPARRRLIAADFGFHNALRQSDGTLRYVDFDYFGWDDPVKLTADFVLHPAMRLGASDESLFASKLASALPEDADFLSRLRRYRPFYALRWALIVLNPFRRDHAHDLPGTPMDRNMLRTERLVRAQNMVERATRHF